jgi:hypothetical protein
MHKTFFKGFILFYALLLLLACNDKSEKQIGSNNNVIVRPSVKQDSIIADVKFDLYCIFTGVKFAFKNDSLHLIDYSLCTLDVDTLSYSSDTLELSVKFSYENKIVNSENCIENGVRKISRVFYGLTSNKILEYVTPWNLGFTEETPTSRYFKPQQPDVIAYIEANRNLINPWYKNEAIRRGIIKIK